MKPRKVVAGVVLTAAAAGSALAIGFGTNEVLDRAHVVTNAEIAHTKEQCDRRPIIKPAEFGQTMADRDRFVVQQVGNTSCQALIDKKQRQKDDKNLNKNLSWIAGGIFGGLVLFGGERLGRQDKENKQQKVIISALYADNNAMSQIISDNQRTLAGMPFDQEADEGRITLEDLEGLSNDIHAAMAELDLFPPEKKATS